MSELRSEYRMNRHMKSICSAVLCGCLVVGSNTFAYSGSNGKDNRTELSNRADNSVREYIDNGCTDRSHDHGTAAGDDETGVDNGA